MKLVRSILIINFYTILSRIFGYARSLLMAHYLGTGFLADALTIAIKIPSFLRRIFAEGAMNTAFVPVFSKLLVNKREARDYATHVFSFMFFVLCIIILVAEGAMPYFIKVCVPGFSNSDRLTYLIDFTRITFPFILLISLTSLYGGILNSFDRFVASSASPLFGNIAIIGLTVALIPITQTPGHAMAWGILLSGFVQLICVAVPSIRMGMGLSLKIPRMTPHVKRFFLLMAPAAAGAGAVQINILVDMMMASYLPTGGISILNYADRLVQLPLSLLGTAVGIALLPLMSRQFRANKITEALDSQSLALEYSLLFTMPAMLGLMLYAQPIVKVLYESGHFDHKATLETGKTIIMLIMGLPAFILIKVFTSSFFAREDSRTPIATAVVCIGVNIILNWILIKSMAHCGLALSTTLSAWLNAAILGTLLYRQHLLVINTRMKRFLPRLFLATLMSGFLLKLNDSWLLPLFYRTKWIQLGAFFILIFGGIGIFFALCFITKTISYKDFKHQLGAVQPT